MLSCPNTQRAQTQRNEGEHGQVAGGLREAEDLERKRLDDIETVFNDLAAAVKGKSMPMVTYLGVRE